MDRIEDLPREAARQPGAAPDSPPPPAARSRFTRVLSWFAVLSIGMASLSMLAIDAAGPSRAVVNIPFPATGPPWTFKLHLTARLVVVVLWAASIVGGAGVAAGLAAVARGARPSPKWMLAAGLTVAAAFTVLRPPGPPTCSTMPPTDAWSCSVTTRT